ncbi:hypothetical protein PCASD_17702 [Puccinia coronata f. sp. avenae]|uniref:Uncharacterized protein n=1 Tax=Puccinia coronata f. sp. avenae TaxID=200324 RepID=A0A2N5TRW9_9BASI|nr:hypothetical protein PCASD_17702 [Puccinia coronata f. sp. avenae]
MKQKCREYQQHCHSLPLLGTTIYLITRRGKHWNHLHQTLAYITPRDLWTLGLLFYSLLMAVLHHTSAGANLLISFLGLSWAVSLTMGPMSDGGFAPNIAPQFLKHSQASREVAKYIAEFGRIEFVVSGAAGNLLCPINQLSSNAFKLVVKIDLLGTYNTVKAT